MELISRSFLNKLINKQYDLNKELSKEDIYKMFGLKPYVREGKSYLYYVKEVNEKGIIYNRDLKGFYPIPKFENKYWINKQAEIINVQNEKKISTYIGTDLYEHVTLQYKGKKYRKRVHSLMAKTFLGNPPVVNHLDGNKSNNRLSNLKRSTHSENIQHAYDNGYYTSRGSKGTSVIVKHKETNKEQTFPSLRQAERFTGVDRHRIKNIVLGKTNNYTDWFFKFK